MCFLDRISISPGPARSLFAAQGDTNSTAILLSSDHIVQYRVDLVPHTRGGRNIKANDGDGMCPAIETSTPHGQA